MKPYTVRAVSAEGTAPPRRPRLGDVAGAIAIAALLPYAALKLAWLLGSSVGATSASAAAELHDARHTAGNIVTLALGIGAVLLVLALVRPWGRRVPVAVVVLPIWVGTGLLAPLALGLPIGLVAQAIAGGSAAPSETGLQSWVYAVVYGGFVVQAVALAAAFVVHARARWPVVLEPRVETPSPRITAEPTRRLVQSGAAAAALYGTANLAWTVAGDRLGAPAGFDTVAQRSLLLSTGLLAFAGAFGVLALGHARAGGRIPQRSWMPVVLAWLGSATCFASGFAQYGLAADASTRPETAVVLGLGTVGGAILAAGALACLPRGARRTRRPPRIGAAPAIRR